MIFIVDGSGDLRDLFDLRSSDVYDRRMRNSFCRRLANQLGEKALYSRGPTVFGPETYFIARAVADHVRNTPPSQPVFLVGYSRGGAAVIAAAAAVERPVQAMFLFDAVDRAIGTSVDVISANVSFVYHAVRDPEFARRHEANIKEKKERFIAQATKYDFKLALEFPTWNAGAEVIEATLKDADHKYIKSRYTAFGNTGRKLLPPGVYAEQLFAGTHGALGGVPWPQIDGDDDAARAVAAWMWTNILKHGIPVRK